MSLFPVAPVAAAPAKFEPEGNYLNYYKHCNEVWEDQWSCMCNDRCPTCNAEIEPFKSEELNDDGQVVETILHVPEDSV